MVGANGILPHRSVPCPAHLPDVFASLSTGTPRAWARWRSSPCRGGDGVVRALTDRERSEFDALGVTVTGECGCAAPDRLPEREVPEAWDWALLRKFNEFWPRTHSAPLEFPWLGDLVTRERAWRWASQFPRFFALVEASDTDVIRGFIARTLTEVEPPSPYEGDGDGGEKRKCCSALSRPPPVPPDWFIDEQGCWNQTIQCLDEEGKVNTLEQLCCFHDGGFIACVPDCSVIQGTDIPRKPPGSPPSDPEILS